jgi:glycosyltransferase involved in cell wall biosynthesis
MKYMVSIIIPVYNCEKYLGRAVESVINQPNFDNLELVLIDDGSKDGSGKICDEFSEKYENIFAFHQPNSGVSVARNLGISKANGDWIAFLDSDDWFLDGAFIKMLRYDDSDLICCDYTSDESCNGCLSDRFVKSVYTKNEFNDTLYRAMINGTSFYSCWNKLYKKSIIIDNDVQFPAGVKYGEDMMFLFTYIKYINSFAFVNEALYFYWINPQNTTSVIKKGFEYCLNQYEWQYKYFNEIECKKSCCI